MKNLFTLLLCIGIVFSAQANLVITGVLDGPLSGGTPKTIELYVLNDIPDLSIYGVGTANNGGGTDGEEYTLPAGMATAGTYLYLTGDTINFNNYFGFDPTYVFIGLSSGLNGDDAIELFENGVVIDVFGDPNVDGTDTAWEHLDSWVYRMNGTGPDGTTFNIDNWIIQPINLLDGTTTNAEAMPPFPLGTYMAETVVSCPGNLYVDASATGMNNGSSWANAYTDLQSALAAADSLANDSCNLDIHIAAGIYYPTTGTSRGASFEMRSHTDLFGGYPAGGGERDPSANETALSGNVDGVNTYDGNSYHVVKAQNVTNVTIDGVSIRDGNADDASSFGRSRGGGVFVNGSSITFNNTEIKWNKAVFGGGLFATLSPEVIFNFCTFKKNTAGNGAALYHSNMTSMYISSSRIINNTSTIRCALEVNNSLYTGIDNTVIANNASQNANAIGFIATNRNQTCDVYNSTILGETKNKNLISMQVGNNDELGLNFYNSIIGHQDPTFDKAFIAYNNNILNLNTENCYIQGSSVIGTSSNNIYSAVVGDLMLNADYSVNECSPVVNMGNDANVVQFFDIDGNPRVFGTVDMGAYEAQVACTPPMRETALTSDIITTFPNPVNDVLYIKTELENVQVFIYDALGKSIQESRSKEVNVSEFPTGVYYLNIFSEGKLMSTEKVVKQ